MVCHPKGQFPSFSAQGRRDPRTISDRLDSNEEVTPELCEMALETGSVELCERLRALGGDFTEPVYMIAALCSMTMEVVWWLFSLGVQIDQPAVRLNALCLMKVEILEWLVNNGMTLSIDDMRTYLTQQNIPVVPLEPHVIAYLQSRELWNNELDMINAALIEEWAAENDPEPLFE